MIKIIVFVISILFHSLVLQIKLDINPADVNQSAKFYRIEIVLFSTEIANKSKVNNKSNKIGMKSNTMISFEQTQTIKENIDIEILPPNYPRISRIKGHQGQVELEYFIDSTGNWVHKRILKSSGFLELDNSALDAMEANRLRLPRQKMKLMAFNFSLK